MKFEEKLITGIIHKRYKRFLADVELTQDFLEYKKGEIITAHTANTGSMKTCWEPGWQVALSYHDNPKRKLKFSLEMTNNGNTWIGINTGLPNKLAMNAILTGEIKELIGYENLRPEVKIGDSRIDILLYDGEDFKNPKRCCYVEVKNVTMLGDNSYAIFPDSVSTRGQKHLDELMKIKEAGHEAAMLYVIQREDVTHFSPAKEIDPVYAKLLNDAHEKGVKVLAYQFNVNTEAITVKKTIPVEL